MSKFIKGPYRYVKCTRPISKAVYYDVLTDSGEMFEDVLCVTELEANARLFAAAPELYEALEELLQLTEHERPDWQHTEQDRARKVLSKARGEA